jgi:hypothetical protein
MSETVIRYVPALGRRVREGTWDDQAISGISKMQEAIAAGRWDEAAKLGNYFVDEALVCFQLYRQWVADLMLFLREHKVDADVLNKADAQIVGTLVRPDGRPFDRNFMWNEFREGVEAFVAHCHREQGEAAKRELEAFVETWRQLHDRDVDHTYGLMSEVVEHLGERAIGEMYDTLLIPLFTWRYEKFDIDKHRWEEALQLLMQVCFEAARSHLFGSERRGDMEVIEYDDRFVLRFDPCGSGGRTVRGDEIEGTPPRMEAPYNWRVSEEPHSWNHFQEGVCLYCSHCIRLMEEMPIDRFGYPVRVVDPPRYVPGQPELAQKCQYTMYKDPTAVPAEVYERVGRTKDGRFGSVANGAPELPDAGINLPGSG